MESENKENKRLYAVISVGELMSMVKLIQAKGSKLLNCSTIVLDFEEVQEFDGQIRFNEKQQREIWNKNIELGLNTEDEIKSIKIENVEKKSITRSVI